MPEKAPLLAVVMKASGECAARIAEHHRDRSDALAQIISILIMDAARNLLTWNNKPLEEITVDFDVVTFEALAFCAYAIRNAYNPMPARGADDYDERMEAYDKAFSEVVNEAFKDAFNIILAVIQVKRGWELLELWNRRVLSYLQDMNKDRMPVQSFLSRVMTIDTAKEPMLNYHGHLLSAGPMMQTVVSAKVMAFVTTMPEGYSFHLLLKLQRRISLYHQGTTADSADLPTATNNVGR